MNQYEIRPIILNVMQDEGWDEHTMQLVKEQLVEWYPHQIKKIRHILDLAGDAADTRYKMLNECEKDSIQYEHNEKLYYEQSEKVLTMLKELFSIEKSKKKPGKNRFKLVTMSMTMNNGDRIVMTQKLIPPSHDCGHYYGYIEDRNKNVIYSFYSLNAPKDPITMTDLANEYERL